MRLLDAPYFIFCDVFEVFDCLQTRINTSSIESLHVRKKGGDNGHLFIFLIVIFTTPFYFENNKDCDV